MCWNRFLLVPEQQTVLSPLFKTLYPKVILLECLGQYICSLGVHVFLYLRFKT